jgi:D-alanine-D-alanine ligase-like ATP-grasp enzyme
MRKMTIKQYADRCGISVQAAHKRIKNRDRYREIIGVQEINTNFFMLEVNTRNGFTKNATSFQK